MQWTERQQQLKAAFELERGYWAPHWNALLLHDPDFFEAFLNVAVVPAKSGPLPPKVKEFIFIAVDAATTHLYEPGLRIHIRNAFQLGATDAEIVEVIELASDLGLQSCAVGIPILYEELRKAGRASETEHPTLSPRAKGLKAAYIECRGYWSPALEALLQEMPDFFAAALQLSASPWKRGPLEPKVKEFIYIAINASTTHLHEPALRIHISNALRYGASKAEILEIIALVSRLGMHSVSLGVSVLQDERSKAEGKGER